MPRRYGWRPSPPDIRDHVYAAPHAVLLTLPPSVDLSAPAVGSPFEPAFEQGDLGSCGPHAAAADLVFAGLRQQGLRSCPMPSRLFIYYCTRGLMGTLGSDSGVDNRSLLKALNQYGWCDESLWPYDVSRYKQKPPTEAFAQGQGRKISQYLAVPQNLDQMRGCLASGDPFIFGFSVYASFESSEVSHTGVVPMPRRGERQLGGHDVLIVGYDDQSRRFKFKNSWGPAWGQRGYGTIPYEYAASAQLSNDFWTVRHAALPPDAPPPPPPAPSGVRLTVSGALAAGSYNVTPVA